MKKTFVKKIIPLVLVICMVVPCFLTSYKQVYGVTEQDIQKAQDEKEQKQNDRDETAARIEELKQESTNTQDYISSLDGMITELEGSLYQLKQDIEALEGQIEEAEANLVVAEAQKVDQYAAMKLRIQFMYEHNDETYLDLLLTAQSMGEMLNRVEYISKISEYDRNMLDRFQETLNTIAATKAELEVSHQEMLEMQTSLTAQKESLDLLQEEKIEELVALQSQTSEAERLLASKEAALKAQDDLLDQLEAQRRAELESGNAGLTPSYDGGLFAWPTVNTYITSNYGDTEGRTSPHRGIDIAPMVTGVSGDPIYAAYDGTVFSCANDGAWNDEMGNYVIISHGDGVYTRYMHASAVLVSKGQTVSKGQVIALMGTTGYSTGVHLHFDVYTYVNGTRTFPSPWNYFG